MRTRLGNSFFVASPVCSGRERPKREACSHWHEKDESADIRKRCNGAGLTSLRSSASLRLRVTFTLSFRSTFKGAIMPS